MGLLQRFFGRSTEIVERRLQPRYRMEMAVAATTADKQQHRGRSVDLSLTGIAVLLDTELAVGDQFEIAYQMGDGSPLQRRTVIVRNRNGKRYGLEFVR